jgi:hypothetical protein
MGARVKACLPWMSAAADYDVPLRTAWRLKKSRQCETCGQFAASSFVSFHVQANTMVEQLRARNRARGLASPFSIKGLLQAVQEVARRRE